jgi:hypothetical protein
MGGRLCGSGGWKNPRRASIVVTRAHMASTTPLRIASRAWRSRHNTRKIAMTTAAVSARMSTASRFVDIT